MMNAMNMTMNVSLGRLINYLLGENCLKANNEIKEDESTGK